MKGKLTSVEKFVLLTFFVFGMVGCTSLVTPTVEPASDPIEPAQSTPLPLPATATATPENRDPLEEDEGNTSALGEEGMITYQTMEFEDNTALEYAVALPDKFDPSQAYPILLALPPGPQDQAMVQVGLDNYWAGEAKERGWIVLSPIAPRGKLFFQGAEALIPEFLERTAEAYRPEGGKYHIAGISNGGISVFRIAGNHPDLFHSVMVLPGFPRSEADYQHLEDLAAMPVTMFVGEQDTSWIQAMEAAEAELSGLGGQVSLEIVPGEGHVIRSLIGGEKLFDLLESIR